MKRRNQRLANVLIVSIALALIAYVTLDTVYFHMFFSADNADVSSIVLTTIVVASIWLEILVQRTGTPAKSSSR